MAAANAPIRVSIAVACRVLGLSTQGYYQWLKEPVSQRNWDNSHLIDVLYEVHAGDATLGYRFLTDELADEYGIRVGENRVHRLCRIAEISASHHKKPSKAGATGPSPHDDVLAVVDDHGVVRHEFVAHAPNTVWLWDISEHPTREGKLYICAINRLGKLSEKRGVPMAQLALAWMLSKSSVTSSIVDASKIGHRQDAIDTLDLVLEDDETTYLEELYEPHKVAGHPITSLPG